MISKKLLEVICPNTKRYTYKIVSGNVEVIDHKWSGIIGTMNIHEVAHKCKEWASLRGHILATWKNTTADKWLSVNIETNKQFREDTEVEAIFAACEWILKQGEKDEL